MIATRRPEEDRASFARQGAAHEFPGEPARRLSYALPDFGVTLDFEPTDFTQVNASLNRVLVRRAIALLEPSPGDQVADFFCGLGNFALPIARRGASVVGVEGSRTMIGRAEGNAQRNGLSERARFVIADLFAATRESVGTLGPLDKVLLDPPREGAIALVKALPDGALLKGQAAMREFSPPSRMPFEVPIRKSGKLSHVRTLPQHKKKSPVKSTSWRHLIQSQPRC